MTRERTGPPMDPNTDEASPAQLEAARAQGDAYGRALGMMTHLIAEDGDQQPAGDYLIGYAVEKAEGLYEWEDGELTWHEPDGENLHVEISVRDAGDGRFVPGLTVYGTLVDPAGNELGTHEHPMLWHPLIYHYGRNWTVPCDGDFTLRVEVPPAPFPRHDDVNGRRFEKPARVEFTGVHVTRGRD